MNPTERSFLYLGFLIAVVGDIGLRLIAAALREVPNALAVLPR